MKATVLIILLFVSAAGYSQVVPNKCPNGTVTRECIATCYSQAIDAYYEGVEGCNSDACRRLAYRLLLAQFELCRILYGDELPMPGETSVYTCPKGAAKDKCSLICETWATQRLANRLLGCMDASCRNQARKEYIEDTAQCKK